MPGEGLREFRRLKRRPLPARRSMRTARRPKAAERAAVRHNSGPGNAGGSCAAAEGGRADLNTVVFKNGDGTRTAYHYALPVKYEENGIIKDKSNRIIQSDRTGYAFENEANEVKTYFPQALGEKGARLEYEGYFLELTPFTAQSAGISAAAGRQAARADILRAVTPSADAVSYNGALGEEVSLRYTLRCWDLRRI